MLLVLLAVVVAFGGQGVRGLSDPDEGRYAEVAREMIVTGDYLHPQLDFHPHYTKPPLTYWAIVAGLKLLGPGEWGVRLFQSVAYALTILLVALTGTVLWGRSTGIRAGGIYATFLLPFAAANIVTTDTLLTFWEALALFAFFAGRRATTHRWVHPALMGAAFGLAFLTKGPPALLFLLALVIWRSSPAGRREAGEGSSARPASAPVFSALGWVLLVAIGLGWFAWAVATTDGLLAYFLGDEVMGRIAGAHHRNAGWLGAVVVYPPVLLLGSLPWSATWPWALRRWRSRVRWAAIPRERPVLWALLLLFLVPLIIFTLARSRLPLYVLPLFLPLALMTARGLDRPTPPGADSPPRTRGWLVPWVLLLLALRLAYARWPGEKDARALAESLPVTEARQIVVADGVRSVHGLAFYTGRDLLYAAWSNEKARREGRPTVSEVLEELRGASGPTPDGTIPMDLVLVKPDGLEDLQRILSRAGLRVHRTIERKKLIALLVGP